MSVNNIQHVHKIKCMLKCCCTCLTPGTARGGFMGLTEEWEAAREEEEEEEEVDVRVEGEGGGGGEELGSSFK